MANPWFRFYADTLNNPKAQKLPGDLFKTWVNLLCIACENDGQLPPLDDVAFKLRATLHDVLQSVATLLEADLLAVNKNQHCEIYSPKNWQKRQFVSDTSTERSKRCRERKRNVSCNVAATPPEQSRTDTDQNRTDSDSAAKVSMFSAHELSQFRQQAPSLSDQEFKNHVSNCELWLGVHGSKTPEVTLSKWLQTEEAKKQEGKKPWSPF